MTTKDKRIMIMKAAEELFLTRRYHEVTTEEVALRAKVGKGTIYRHFKDKDDLFFQTAMAGLDELASAIRAHIPGDAPIDRKLSAVCRTMHEFFKARRPMIRLMIEHEVRTPANDIAQRNVMLEHRRRIDAAVEAVLKEGVAKGVLRSDIDPGTLALFLIGMMRMRDRDAFTSPESAPTIEQVIEVFLNGAGAAKPAGKRNDPARGKRRGRK